ncbi:MAG: hypothetical protein HYT87_02135 [Nitrospirae bacterium]|nr:hypothetical protein [Nitrospirota bacterium]
MARAPERIRGGDDSMREDEVVGKNLDLLREFLLFAFAHPEVLDKIPPAADLVFLPEDDKLLYEINQRILRERRKQGKVAVVRVRGGAKPKPVFTFVRAA